MTTKQDLAIEYCHCASCLDYAGCKNGDDSCSKFDGYLNGYTACEGEMKAFINKRIKYYTDHKWIGDELNELDVILAFLDELEVKK